jgi:hypothetical protein
LALVALTLALGRGRDQAGDEKNDADGDDEGGLDLLGHFSNLRRVFLSFGAFTLETTVEAKRCQRMQTPTLDRPNFSKGLSIQ